MELYIYLWFKLLLFGVTVQEVTTGTLNTKAVCKPCCIPIWCSQTTEKPTPPTHPLPTLPPPPKRPRVSPQPPVIPASTPSPPSQPPWLPLPTLPPPPQRPTVSPQLPVIPTNTPTLLPPAPSPPLTLPPTPSSPQLQPPSPPQPPPPPSPPQPSPQPPVSPNVPTTIPPTTSPVTLPTTRPTNPTIKTPTNIPVVTVPPTTPTQPPRPGEVLCEVPLKKMGCWVDDEKKPRPLPEYILSDRDSTVKVYSNKNIDWKNWINYLPDFVCRCAKLAKSKDYTFFGAQFYGECWSGPSKDGSTYKRNGTTNECVDTEWETCDDNSKLVCSGKQYANYVYKIV